MNIAALMMKYNALTFKSVDYNQKINPLIINDNILAMKGMNWNAKTIAGMIKIKSGAYKTYAFNFNNAESMAFITIT